MFLSEPSKKPNHSRHAKLAAEQHMVPQGQCIENIVSEDASRCLLLRTWWSWWRNIQCEFIVECKITYAVIITDNVHNAHGTASHLVTTRLLIRRTAPGKNVFDCSRVEQFVSYTRDLNLRRRRSDHSCERCVASVLVYHNAAR